MTDWTYDKNGSGKWEPILGAVARGWCSPKNSGKEMDVDLAEAIAQEVAALLVAPVKLEDSEQYRMQIAGICTAAIGYWKESDSVHPDYDTIALRDVARLYAKYDELYRAAHAEPSDAALNDAYAEGRKDEREANADLLAAAQGMLSADDGDMTDAWKNLHAAIARFTGEPQ